jgi:hypothetical protein
MQHHKVHTGPQGGKFQTSRAGDRYLLEGKKVHTGPQGGKFQVYDGNKHRHLLK